MITLSFNRAILLAQSTGDAAKDTADKTQKLLTEITTWRITQALFLILMAYITLKVMDKVVIWLSEKVAREWRLRIKQFLPFLRMMVLSTTVITLLNMFLRLSQENLLTITGTIAVALGFAFKDYASSVIAGLVGLFEAPYRIGDRIRIEDHYGEVISYGLRGVRLRTPDDNIVTIPHNKIWTDAVSNANMGELEAQVVTRFYLSHEVNPQRVKKILYRVAHTSKYTHLKLPIVVIVEEKPWGTEFRLKCYPLDARDEFVFQTDLTTRAKEIFDHEGFAYPHLLSLDAEHFGETQ